MRVIRYFWMFGNSMLVDTYLLDILINIFSAILGLFYSKFFFSFMLLDIIGRSDILKNVIQSVTKNFGQFLMTALLGVIVIYVFASITYFSELRGTMNFLDDTDPDPSVGDPGFTFSMCSSLPHCFLTLLNFGMRSGGGIGETLLYPSYTEDTSKFMGRFVLDLLFFFMINTIYLDILFGIIIDTFEELRNAEEIKSNLLF